MIEKPFVIKQEKFFDKEGFSRNRFKKKIKIPILFTAVVESKKNVIRGLHFQKKNKQTKIIHVIDGKILDVVVNLKKNLKITVKSINLYLIKVIFYLFLIFAHGYECLSKKCIVLYHLDNYRDAKNEDGIKFNDKKLKIKWFTKKPLISNRDKKSNSFEYFEKNKNSLNL